MKMTALEFSCLVELNIRKELNNRLKKPIPAAPGNRKWDKLPQQSLFSFQLEDGIAKNPVFEGLLGKIDESVQLFYEAKETSKPVKTFYGEEPLCSVPTLQLRLELRVPGRPIIALGQDFAIDRLALETPAAAFYTAQDAIEKLLTADPFLKLIH